ncbi:MAG: DNA adenine methylase [Chloroflexi bacterium]|nr:MAG: DNA adenine methylase [Chloroflexota bacterium]
MEAVNIYPKPFLKWAGGKTQLLPQLTPFFPRYFERYSEPFTGGAAVYWQLFTLRKQGLIQFKTARLTDANAELINCYVAVRDNVDELIVLLTRHRERHSKDYYYSIRSLQVENLSPVERAARFIYLNKTCYNGLYRVNRSGQFNVPMGSYVNPRVFEEAELKSASFALQGVELKTADFREVLSWAQAGDFIYFDPPYAPLSKTSSFTSYTETPFGEEEQQALASVFRELDHRGCKLMLSNSWVDDTLALYKDFNCIAVKASRAINSNPEGRGKIRELLVLNYEV